ncbi:flagellar motility protein MotE (MotC chaperone) [Virgibacillus halotolerans]|uniref:MotE family protein n=1 Tax=Virgibacillus halotolerans TaxID=1071053 RepID=UPI001960534C|nr:hypothetical protein [Virgibacillus halotolerans]MBM7598593.1 flagellar motility protein MotE (MotC chaperone) [Virgibacillus halotolerans]
MAEDTKKEKKKMNPILWFLFVIIVPLLIILFLTIFILSIAGFSVLDWTKEKVEDVPIISALVTTEQEPMKDQEKNQMLDKLASKDEEIEQLNQEVEDLEATIEELEHEQAKLEGNSDSAEDTSDSLEDKQADNPLKTASGSFKDMDSEQAALIIQNMEKETATAILEAVSPKVRGKIMEAMDPEKAAELTQLIIDEEEE